MQNEIGIRYLHRASSGQQAAAGVHAIVDLFLECHQKDLQRRCRLCSTDPGEAWWPGDVHENNLNRLGQAWRVHD
jgi:hypothetical protein